MKKLISGAAPLLAALLLAHGIALAANQHDMAISSPSAQANVRAVARISVRPRGAFHVTTEYPVKLTINAPAGVTLEKPKQTMDDAKRLEKAAIDFEVALTALASGKKGPPASSGSPSAPTPKTCPPPGGSYSTST